MKMNKIVLGTVQFGLPYGINNTIGQIQKEEVFEILNLAQKKGIVYIDTAAAYGNAEEILGEYFNSNQKHSFRVITKFSFKDNNTCEQSLLESLFKLRQESVDTIMFHSFADYQAHLDELPSFIKNFKGSKFFNIGVSVYTNQEAEATIDNKDINIVQLPFNLLDNNIKRNEIFIKLKSAGKTIHTRSVFLQGLFLKNLNLFPESLKDLKTSIQNLNKIAESNNTQISELALSYALANQNIDNVLIGVDSLKQFTDNISYSTFSLPKNAISDIDKINISNIDLLNPSKWKI